MASKQHDPSTGSDDAWWKKLGPGLITGAADDDPSGIATCSQGGAQHGYDIAWTVPITYPLMVGIQLASARIGRITGKGLTENFSRFCPRWLVLGLVALLLQVFLTCGRSVKVLKWLTLSLLAYVGMGFSNFIALFMIVATAATLRVLVLVCTALSSSAVLAADASNADERTLVPSLSYDSDAGFVTQGGKTDGSTYTGLLHLRLRWIVPTASAWRGTSAFVDVRNIEGGHLSELAGDAQGVTNVDGPDGSAIHELWIQHNFQWSGVSLLSGIYDLNSEFDRVQAAGLFLNSSFGITPEFAESGNTGPSIYPRTAAAVRLAARPWNGALLRAALVDGASFERPGGSHALFKRSDGVLEVVEWSMLRRPDATGDEPVAPRIFGRFAPLPTYEDKIALGVWRYSRRLHAAGATGADPDRYASEGAYAIGEWRLLGRGADAKKRLSGFAQLGFASPSTNRFGRYVGGGLVATGWLFGRDSDQVGISVASAQEGSTYRRNTIAAGVAPARAETTWEASYLSQLEPWFTLAPDVQVVTHPDADATRRTAVVLQVRSEMSF